MDGIRTVKTNGSTIHHYTLNGSQIVTETWTTKSSSGAETPNHFLVYLYDENGAPVGLQYRNKTYGTYTFDTYYFEKNLQGDIIAIYTENGTKIGSYTYDAWGNCTVSTESGATTSQKRIVRTLNPFRYRGYYYDTETGLYYLQSRYYNPKWGRFLNADGYVNANGDLIGFNMYAYCGNNPVGRLDFSGYSWEELEELGDFVATSYRSVRQKIKNLVGVVYETVTNTDEEKVRNANLFAFYKGRLVIKIDAFDDCFMDGEPQGASFGIIFIDSRRSNFSEDLKHEWGHTVQYASMGPINYLLYVAIPSVKGYKSDLSTLDYYSQPWEYTADRFGGVSGRQYREGAEEAGWRYYWDVIRPPMIAC